MSEKEKPTESTPAPAGAPSSTDELPPPAQPPRPLSPGSQNQKTLEEAFPSIETSIIRAVLVASRGELEPAFNALLSMSDPSAVETPPPPPPRPRRADPGVPVELLTSTPQSQLDADAQYARQLAAGYDVPRPHRNDRGGSVRDGGARRRHDDSDDDYYYDDERDRPSFLEEDLPVIKENIKKGFLETQTKVTGWFNDLKKKIESDLSPETSPPASTRTSGQYARSGARGGGRGGLGGRTGTESGYDADNQVLGDDFIGLSLRDNTSDSAMGPRRPKANPNLFQPTASSGRKVSFEDRTDKDDDLYRVGTKSPARQPSPVSGGGKKWEPLKSVEPEPIHKDPFSLEDSDDEKDGLIKEEPEAAPAASKSVTGPQETGVTKSA